ncbi:hypothetical protein [Chitinophaga rhizosphaerae]|uniref:hypothetical protein n=1 Tax=Chitinophaga rhizosphaerae TaxID=1864947 RepID=UPI000F812BA5|nr:hypothetical protein [Chitinophaga rhizosphaerae]
MSLRFTISFPEEQLPQSGEVLKLVLKHLPFQPVRMLSPLFAPSYTRFNKKKIDEYIETMNSVDENKFWLEEGEGIDPFEEVSTTHSFSFNWDKSNKVKILTFRYPEDVKPNAQSLLDVFQVPFTFAFVTDSSKIKWQNEKFIKNYIAHGRPYQHLKLEQTSQLAQVYGPMIDITENPGHEAIVLSMDLMAAPEMWFGPLSQPYFDRKLLLSFPDAIHIDLLCDETVYVNLFDVETSDYELAEILELQRKFRKWVRMNEVESMLISPTTKPNNVMERKIEFDEVEKPKVSTTIWKIVKGKKDKD